MTDCALIIFLKTPKPGFVKTRLQPELTKEESGLLYTAFLQDIQIRFEKREEFTCWYAVAPEEYEVDKLAAVIQSKNIFLQTGNDLGQRMTNAMTHIFKKGYQNILLIGSDIPQLPLSLISTSFNLLKQKTCHLILGPADDGGYYLIGMFELIKDIFHDISWSTASVFEQTLEKARRQKYIVHILKHLSDIDDYSSLRNLYRYIGRLNRDSEDFPSQTWIALNKIMKLNK